MYVYNVEINKENININKFYFTYLQKRTKGQVKNPVFKEVWNPLTSDNKNEKNK